MAQVLTEERNNNNFHSFFESWLVEQDHYLEELVSASQLRDRLRNSDDGDADTILRQKIARVIDHYEQYYRAKSTCAKNDAVPMFNPPWRSSLEDAFLWIGGWRPSMAFHLLYSKSGLQLQDKLAELLQGLAGGGDLADLSPAQVNQVDELQRATIREEKEITEKLAKQQEKVADTSMVELSNAVSEAMRNPAAAAAVDGGRVAAALATKEVGLAEVLQNADDLRLKTLKRVLGILSPIQGVHFLIAAAELHLRLHDWGMKRDAAAAAADVGRGRQI